MQKYFIASCSYGKDSIAMLLKIKELGLPLDEVIFVELWFDNEIPANVPEQVEFIKYARNKLEKEYGIKITHIRSPKTFKDYFYQVKQRGNFKGTIYGFPMIIRGKGWCTDRLKIKVIDNYLKQLDKQYEVYRYIGIALNEKNRMQDNPRYIYPLVEQGIDENQAYKTCEDLGLLSPIYQTQFRDGCWFCPKQKLSSLKSIYNSYPDLWKKLVEIDKDSPVIYKINKTVKDLDNQWKIKQLSIFDFEECNDFGACTCFSEE